MDLESGLELESHVIQLVNFSLRENNLRYNPGRYPRYLKIASRVSQA